MAPVTAYDVSIDLHLRGLRSLKQILVKASSHPEAATFPSAKLYEDMMPLTVHVQSCSNVAKGGLERLTDAGKEADVWADDETTMEQLVARVDKTIVLLESAKPESLDGVEERTIELHYGPQTIKWDGRGYILGYSIPNFMFHLCVTYSTLRARGVDVGKMDYLTPFMEGMTLPA